MHGVIDREHARCTCTVQTMQIVVIYCVHAHGRFSYTMVNYRASARSDLPVITLLIVRAHGLYCTHSGYLPCVFN